MHFTGSVNGAIKRTLARVVVSIYILSADITIPQSYIKWFTKLTFVLKITQFLVNETFFHHQAKKVSSQRANPFSMLLIFVVKSQLKAMHAHLTKKL